MTRIYVTRPYDYPLDIESDAGEVSVLPSGALHVVEGTPEGSLILLLAPGRWSEVYAGPPEAVEEALR